MATRDKAVQNPAHYGGADNPYETIKVMRAWLSPIELIGALKFNIFTYAQRAPHKNGYEDIRKASWYQFYLDSFVKERIAEGDVHVLGGQVWWLDGGEGEVHADKDSLYDEMHDTHHIYLVNTNHHPFQLTCVMLPVEDGSPEPEWFETIGQAKSYLKKFDEGDDRETVDQINKRANPDYVAPTTAEEAVAMMEKDGDADPEGSARMNWPALFIGWTPKKPEEKTPGTIGLVGSTAQPLTAAPLGESTQRLPKIGSALDVPALPDEGDTGQEKPYDPLAPLTPRVGALDRV